MQFPYYERVPKTTAENLRWRRYLTRRCLENARFRDAVMEACRVDFLFYVNSWVWQFNPKRVSTEIEPFITWPYQDAAFRVILGAIEGQTDLCIEKSREMGATWMCLLPQDWYAKFHEHKQMGVISRDADAVDNGNISSLLPKLDFISEHQPEWMVGEVEKWVKGLRRKYHRTKSEVIGEASTGKAFVGGRLFWLFVDEFSQIGDGYTVQRRTRDVTRCRIFNFTHVGAVGHAYDLAQRPDVAKLVMHWSEHPHKNAGLYRWDVERNTVVALDTSYQFPPDYPFVTDGSPGGPYPGIRSPWYDEECRVRGSAQAVAEDLDINPEGSTRQFFDPVKVQEHKRLYSSDPQWVGEMRFDDVTGTPYGLTETTGGLLNLWLTPDRDGQPPRARYAIACDISAGTGASNSTLSIANVLTGEKVGEFADPHVKPDPFARLAVALARWFRDEDGDGALLCWEVSGPFGKLFWDEVTALKYSRLYWGVDPAAHTRSNYPGWANTQKTQPIILREYAAALYAGHFVNRSAIALDECLKFCWTPLGKVEHTGFAKGERDDPSGARENHGDRVIADAQLWMLMKGEVTAKPENRERAVEEHPWGSFGWRQGLRRNGEKLGWLDPRRRTPREPGVTIWSASR